MSRPPFCVDCTHRSKFSITDRCVRQRGYLDLTTGKQEISYELCSIERMMDEYVGREQCGASGKFFQQNTSVWYRIKKWFSGKFN